MNRNFWLGAGLMTLLVVGLLFLLGGPSALFGTSGSRGADSGGEAPDELAGARDEAGGGSAAGKTPRSAVLFGRRREESRGVGSLRARVVRYKDQQAIANARVAVSGMGFGGETVAVEATTDATGAAFLDAVAAGQGYEVRVDASGEGSLTLPGVDVAAARTTDLGTVFLGAKAVLSGRVVDESGAGIAGADVRAFRGQASLVEILGNMAELFASLDREPDPVAKTKADANGRFALPDLAPGGFMVRATAPERRQALVKVEMTSNGPAGGEPTLVLDRGAVVAGRVVDGEGRAVVGARLAFVAGGGGDDPFAFIYGRVFALSDGNGAFRAVVSDEEGEIRAIVAAEGFPTAMSGSIRAGDTDVKIVLKGGARLDVTVVEKAGARPIEGAQVVVMVSEGSMGDSDAGGAMLVGATDERGERSFAVPPGSIQMLFVSHPRHPGGVASSFTVGTENQGGIEVEGDFSKPVAAGSVARVLVRLQTGVALVGRVLAPDGTPIAGAEIRPLTFAGMGGGSATSARSGADGAYRLEGIHPSPQTFVFVKAAGWVQPTDKAIVKETPDARGEIARDFTLHRASTVRGRVVDAQGNGVAGARVSVADDGPGAVFGQLFGGGASSVTALDGTYVVQDVNARGAFDFSSFDVGGAAGAEKPKTKLRVTASADGWVKGKSEPFEAVEGGTTEAPAVTLARGGRLSGKVVDPSGRSLPGARVQASPATEENDFSSMFDPSRLRNARTGAGGTFEFLTLPAGDVTLTASGEGFAASRRTVPVAADATNGSVGDVEVRLRPALEVHGKVLDTDGSPVVGARASVQGPLEGREGDEGFVQDVSGKTDAQGAFTVKGVPPGRVSVRVAAEGFRPSTMVLEAGGAPFEFRLSKRSAGDAKRLAEIQQELGQLGQKYMAAKDEAEKKALQQRMMELLQEQQALKGKDGDSPEPPEPPEAVPEEPGGM